MKNDEIKRLFNVDDICTFGPFFISMKENSFDPVTDELS